jgi:hypothetical protein
VFLPPKSHWFHCVLIAIAVLIAAARPFMPTHAVSMPGSYEAMAHLFVGGVVGAWIATRQRWLLAIGVCLSIVEVVCALFGTMSK